MCAFERSEKGMDFIMKSNKKRVQNIKNNNFNNKKILDKKDVIIILIITLIYAILSFINLGSFTNPQTFWKARRGRRKCYYKNKK